MSISEEHSAAEASTIIQAQSPRQRTLTALMVFLLAAVCTLVGVPAATAAPMPTNDHVLSAGGWSSAVPRGRDGRDGHDGRGGGDSRGGGAFCRGESPGFCPYWR